MTGEPTPIAVQSNMTSEQAWDFLDKIVTDADFRSELETDLPGALSRRGYDLDVSGIPTAAVPEPEEIHKLFDLISPGVKLGSKGPIEIPVFATCPFLTVALAAATSAAAGPGPASTST
jgi:hypothetical protein